MAVLQNVLSAAFDCVSHSSFLYKLRVVGVCSAVFDFIAGFLRGGVQMMVVDVDAAFVLH